MRQEDLEGAEEGCPTQRMSVKEGFLERVISKLSLFQLELMGRKKKKKKRRGYRSRASRSG